MKRSNSYVHHFNYCQWRIPRGVVAVDYSKRMFLNTQATAVAFYRVAQEVSHYQVSSLNRVKNRH